MARRPNAVAVAANRIVVAGMKPPPKPMMAISAARPPRIRTIAFGVDALALRKVAAPAPGTRLPSASRASPTATTIRHRLRPDAVGRAMLQRLASQRITAGDQRRAAPATTHAGGVDAAVPGFHASPSPSRAPRWPAARP